MFTGALRSLSLVLALTGVLSISACAPANTSTTEGATSSPETAVVSESLLDAATQTVLDQALTYPAAAPAQVSSSIITIPPGVETGLHRHDAPMYAYILEGELTVTYDDDITRVYRAGDAILEAVGTAHNGKNTGDLPVRVLVVNMGAEGVANTVTLP